MLFNELLEKDTDDLSKPKINRRKAVRAIIYNAINENQILLIRTNRGDYKFPGGGIKKNENHEDALFREVKEETGFSLSGEIIFIGKMIEKGPDSFEENAIFEMESFYYRCKIAYNIQLDQNLDDYEKEQDFKPFFIPIKDAIINNKKLIFDSNKNNIKINDWVERETLILNKLYEL